MRVRSLVGYGLMLGLILAQGVPAGAEPFTWEFSGQVTRITHHTPLDALFPIGTTVTFTATFDNTLPDECGGSGAGLYWLQGGTVSFGGGTYTSGRYALEVNNPHGNCPEGDANRPQDATVRYLELDAPWVQGAAVGWIGGPDVGGGMPSQLPNLLGAHFLLAYECIICYAIQGEITTVHLVPEPATLALTAAGGAVLWRRKRNRRSRPDARDRRRIRSI